MTIPKFEFVDVFAVSMFPDTQLSGGCTLTHETTILFFLHLSSIQIVDADSPPTSHLFHMKHCFQVKVLRFGPFH